MSDETAIESLQYIMDKYQDSTITLACTRAIEEIVESRQEEMDLNRRINGFKDEIERYKSCNTSFAEAETKNLVMVTLLSGIAAGNNSRKDAAEYIKAMLKRLNTSPEESKRDE